MASRSRPRAPLGGGRTYAQRAVLRHNTPRGLIEKVRYVWNFFVWKT